MTIIWMARGGLTDPQIKAISRHSDSSNSYYSYIQAGYAEAQLAATIDEVDEIFKVWCPKPAVLTPTLVLNTR